MAKLDISKTISRAFDTMGNNLGVFLGLALLLAGLPGFLTSWWTAQYAIEGDWRATLAIYGSREFLVPAIPVMLVSMVTHAVLQAALSRATVRSLTGQRPEFSETLETGLQLFLPVLAISCLFSVATGLGLLLLIVPGVMLWLCWCVAIHAYVQEREGIFAAFGRSLELTSGERGRIFLIMLLVTIGVVIVNFILGTIFGLFFGMFADALGAGPTLLPALGQGITGAASSMIVVTQLATIYVSLIENKEGRAGSELEKIFD